MPRGIVLMSGGQCPTGGTGGPVPKPASASQAVACAVLDASRVRSAANVLLELDLTFESSEATTNGDERPADPLVLTSQNVAALLGKGSLLLGTAAVWGRTGCSSPTSVSLAGGEEWFTLQLLTAGRLQRRAATAADSSLNTSTYRFLAVVNRDFGCDRRRSPRGEWEKPAERPVLAPSRAACGQLKVSALSPVGATRGRRRAYANMSSLFYYRGESEYYTNVTGEIFDPMRTTSPPPAPASAGGACAAAVPPCCAYPGLRVTSFVSTSCLGCPSLADEQVVHQGAGISMASRARPSICPEAKPYTVRNAHYLFCHSAFAVDLTNYANAIVCLRPQNLKPPAHDLATETTRTIVGGVQCNPCSVVASINVIITLSLSGFVAQASGTLTTTIDLDLTVRTPSMRAATPLSFSPALRPRVACTTTNRDDEQQFDEHNRAAVVRENF